MNKTLLMAGVALLLSIGAPGAQSDRTFENRWNIQGLHNHARGVVVTGAVPAGPAKLVMLVPNDGTGLRIPDGEPTTFSRAQRDVIRKYANLRVSGATDLTIEIGRAVPPTVELYTLPDAAYMEGQMLRPYRYFRGTKEIVVVDPQERRIIEVIED